MTDTPAAAGTLVERLREVEAVTANIPNGLLYRNPQGRRCTEFYAVPASFAKELAHRLADQADELSACRAELAAWDEEWPGGLTEAEAAWRGNYDRAEQSERLLAAAERDAARYRWLRKSRLVLLLTGFFGNGCINKLEEDADDYIDAALASKDSPK